MNTSKHSVQGLIRDVRRQWRRRALLYGGSAAGLVLLAAAFAWVATLRWLVLPAPGPLVVLVLGLAATLAAAWIYLGRPLRRRITDRQFALYIEERMPELHDRLNSAVELEAAPLAPEDRALVERLIADAAVQLRGVPATRFVEPGRERGLAYATGALAFLFLIFAGTSIDDVRTVEGTPVLAVAQEAFMTVEPGSAELEKGESQEIVVQLREAVDGDVVIRYREGEGAWMQAAMQAGLDGPAFLHIFEDIQEPIQYFVTAAEERSDVFDLTLYEFPAVRQVDVAYRLPAYTRRAAYSEEDTGDVRGLVGSTVTIDVHTTGAPVEGALVFDDGRRVALERRDDGTFRGAFRLEQDGYYEVELRDAQEKQNKFPEEYRVTALEDLEPVITLTDPQRDVRVNPIEEVRIAAEVYDDYSVEGVRLRFSVNGEEEQTVELASTDSLGLEEVRGEHLFFLEDYALEPGDVISYYVEAEDALEGRTPAATDMYFIEVIPYDQEFTQQANMGGGGQAPQSSAVVLNQQQIITATWKLLRERDDMDPQDFRESARALVQAQQNLKTNIQERLSQTAFSLEMQADADSRKVVEYLRAAVSHMEEAVSLLDRQELKDALQPERKALNNLLRADALNTERQVAMNRQQGGGGQGSSSEERMTELMDLELDISRDKYETQQQRSQQQRNSEVDQALEKIRELARKQQSLANQSRQQMTEEERRRELERLKRDQDEIREQAEELARNMQRSARENQQLSRSSQERLEQAIDDMRQAEQALRRGDMQEAVSRQQQAMNDLERLQRELERTGDDNTRRQLERMASDFDELREREAELGRQLEQAGQDAQQSGRIPSRERIQDLLREREELTEDYRAFEEDAEALEETARGEDQELARSIRALRQQMAQEKVDESMENAERAIAQGWLDYARQMQENVDRSLERMSGRVDELAGSLPETQEEQLAEALEQVRDLMRELERMRPQESEGQPGEPGQRGQQSEQGQPGQGQPGQGQGQGQDGQRGERADRARLERQMDEAREALDRIQEGMGGDARARGLVQDLRRNLGRADHTGQLLGENAKDYFEQEIFAPLSALEQELAQRLDRLEMERKLYGARKGEVPAAYRELVEKYYESLSKTNR